MKRFIELNIALINSMIILRNTLNYDLLTTVVQVTECLELCGAKNDIEGKSFWV